LEGEGVGADGIPHDGRAYDNARLALSFDMAKDLFVTMEDLSYDILWMVEHHCLFSVLVLIFVSVCRGKLTTLLFCIVALGDGGRSRIAVGGPQGRKSWQVIRKAVKQSQEFTGLPALTICEHAEQRFGSRDAVRGLLRMD
jgi:hypothetical protein